MRTLSLPLTEKLRSWRTRSSSGRYRTWSPSTTMAPSAGHTKGGTCPRIAVQGTESRSGYAGAQIESEHARLQPLTSKRPTDHELRRFAKHLNQSLPLLTLWRLLIVLLVLDDPLDRVHVDLEICHRADHPVHDPCHEGIRIASEV